MSRTLAELTADFEAVSKIYAERCGFVRDGDWFLLKVQEEAGELAQAYLQLTKRGKDRGESAETARRKFEDEASDLLGQLLIFAHHHGIDLEAAADRKWFSYLPKRGTAA
jgi:NTP pyrophosphatase (non-canonical NTP hydrolase)